MSIRVTNGLSKQNTCYDFGDESEKVKEDNKVQFESLLLLIALLESGSDTFVDADETPVFNAEIGLTYDKSVTQSQHYTRGPPCAFAIC
jgi:hypothetical protein